MDAFEQTQKVKPGAPLQRSNLPNSTHRTSHPQVTGIVKNRAFQLQSARRGLAVTTMTFWETALCNCSGGNTLGQRTRDADRRTDEKANTLPC